MCAHEGASTESEHPMSKSTLPPVVPTQGGGRGLVVVLLLLLGGGGVIAWKMSQEDSKSEEPPPPVKVVEAPTIPEPPPPPPPPPPPEMKPSPAPKKQKQKQKATAGVSGSTSGSNGCSKQCDGTPAAGFQSALRTRALQARGCYNIALRNNSALQGRMTVAIKVSPSGTACSVATVSDTLGDPSVAACVKQKFRAGAYPKPRGGCVQAQAPLNFVGK